MISELSSTCGFSLKVKAIPGDEMEIPEASRNCVDSFVEAVDFIEKNFLTFLKHF